MNQPTLSIFATMLAMGCAPAIGAVPQDRLDRVDPAIIERDLPQRPDAATPPPSTTAAQPTSSVAMAESGVLAGAIRVEGAQVLRPGDFAGVIEPFIGRRLDDAGLRGLAGAIAKVARDAGFVFASAWIPQQRVASGVLVVRIDEGRIDDIRIAGDSSPAVRATLMPLTDGRPVRRAALERALLLAGDLPGVRVRDSQFARIDGRGVLTVRIDRDRIVGRSLIDNYGSDAIGPVRARLRIDVNGVFAGDDQLRLQGVITPIDPREFGLVSADYVKRIGTNGAELSLSGYYAKSRPDGSLRRLLTIGESHEVTLGASYPISRTRDASLWATTEITARGVTQMQRASRVRQDDFANLRVGLNGFAPIAGGSIAGGASITRGLGLLDATAAGDPLASRRDGSARFTKIDAYAAWTRDISAKVSVRLAAEGQVASRALLASEEFGLGGPRFLRGYDYSERLGDNGIVGAAEIRYNLGDIAKPIRKTQLYAFVDGGVADNKGSGDGGGSLASSGGGVRMSLRNGLSATLEAAVPLSGRRFESRDRSPRLSFTIAASF